MAVQSWSQGLPVYAPGYGGIRRTRPRGQPPQTTATFIPQAFVSGLMLRARVSVLPAQRSLLRYWSYSLLCIVAPLDAL
jgi:hypothetical protein